MSATIRPRSGTIVPGPEDEHRTNEFGSQLRNALLEPGLRHADPLLELGVEALEVEFVQLPEVRAVRSVHLIEPVYQFVGDLVAERVEELA